MTDIQATREFYRLKYKIDSTYDISLIPYDQEKTIRFAKTVNEIVETRAANLERNESYLVRSEEFIELFQHHKTEVEAEIERISNRIPEERRNIFLQDLTELRYCYHLQDIMSRTVGNDLHTRAHVKGLLNFSLYLGRRIQAEKELEKEEKLVSKKIPRLEYTTDQRVLIMHYLNITESLFRVRQEHNINNANYEKLLTVFTGTAGRKLYHKINLITFIWNATRGEPDHKEQPLTKENLERVKEFFESIGLAETEVWQKIKSDEEKLNNSLSH